MVEEILLCHESGAASIDLNFQESGRHDFRAEQFGRQCAKSGSHTVGLQENSRKINIMQNNI